MIRAALVSSAAALAACSASGSTAHDGGRRASQPAPFEFVALGPVRGDLALGLGRLQASVAGCVAGSGPERLGAGGETILRLEIETLHGGLRIVDVALPGGDAEDDRAAACARQALRGRIMPSALARAGRSFEMPFRLSAGTAASARDLALGSAALGAAPDDRPRH